MASKTRSEDTLIFNALTLGLTKMDIIYESIEEFCKVKQEADPSDRFNIILFQEDGPNYLEEFTLNPENILIALKSLEPILVKANVAGGIFVAITFIIDVFKRISEKCFRLIILTDSGSLKIPPHFIMVLQDLIDKVHTFPFYIDVVRIDIDDPREDLKLMKLARRCHGDIHEINDPRSLPAILEVLAIKREVSSVSLLSDKIDIPEENFPFLENLADEPITVEEETTCSVCFQKDTTGIVKCPKCDTVAHKKCWSHWAKNSNIGIFYVFRCHNCYNLIKIDKDYVFAVSTGKEPVDKDAIKVEEVDYLTYLQSLESDEGPQIIQMQDPLAFSEDSFEWEEEGEDEGIDFSIDLDVDALMEESYETMSDDDLQIVWCDNCGKITTNEFKRCPSCDHPLGSS